MNKENENKIEEIKEDIQEKKEEVTEEIKEKAEELKEEVKGKTKEAKDKVENANKKGAPIIPIIIAVVVAIAAIVTIVLVSNNANKTNAVDDTAAVSNDTAVVADSSDTAVNPDETQSDSDVPQTSIIAFTEEDGSPSTDAKGNQVTAIVEYHDEPVMDTNVPDETIYVTDTNEVGYPAVTSYEVPVVVVTEGTKELEWKELALPSDIPTADNLIKYYTGTFEESESMYFWSYSFDITETDYEAWLTKLRGSGWYLDADVVNRYSNGNTIIDVEEEFGSDETMWVGIDVYQCKDPQIPNVFPAFSNKSCAQFWIKKASSVEVTYGAAEDWYTDILVFEQKLMEENYGFSIEGNTATLTKDGKTYTVTWSDDSRVLTYTY